RFRVVAREEAAAILGVDIFVADEGGGVGVSQHILLEPLDVGQNIVDEPAEKRDIAAWADREVEVGDRRSAAEPWVDMDQGGAAFFSLHWPAEPDGMVFRHVAAHDQDRVRVGQILLKGGRPTSAKACPQTGDGGAMSYSGLVLDRDDAQ